MYSNKYDMFFWNVPLKIIHFKNIINLPQKVIEFSDPTILYTKYNIFNLRNRATFIGTRRVHQKENLCQEISIKNSFKFGPVL